MRPSARGVRDIGALVAGGVYEMGSAVHYAHPACRVYLGLPRNLVLLRKETPETGLVAAGVASSAISHFNVGDAPCTRRPISGNPRNPSN